MTNEIKKMTIGLKLAIIILSIVRPIFYWAFLKLYTAVEGELQNEKFKMDISFLKSLYYTYYHTKLSKEFPMVVKRQHKGKARYDMLLVKPPEHDTIVVRFERHTPSGQEYFIEYDDNFKSSFHIK